MMESGHFPTCSRTEELIKLTQDQLQFLEHANECMQADVLQGTANQCSFPYCRAFKHVLRHIESCTSGKDCLTPLCATSREILAHWEDCEGNNCPVCSPLILKKKIKKQTSPANTPRKQKDQQNISFCNRNELNVMYFTNYSMSQDANCQDSQKIPSSMVSYSSADFTIECQQLRSSLDSRPDSGYSSPHRPDVPLAPTPPFGRQCFQKLHLESLVTNLI